MKQTILLTGATGFLGSHLLESLLIKYNVVILKRSTSNIWRIQHLLEKIISYDIDLIPLEEIFNEHKINVVIHTACHYGRNNDSILNVIESNLMFGLRVLEASVKFNVNTFINTDSLLAKKINTYALSKAQFVEWLEQISGEIQIINFKIEHMYGLKDDSTKLVSWVIGQLKNNEIEIKLTKGEQLRDFIHVEDVVTAYIIALDKRMILGKFNEFEVGSGQLIRVKDFLEKLLSLYEKNIGPTKTKFNFGAIPYRDGEQMVVELDNSALKTLGWGPKIQLTDGLTGIIKE